MDPTIVDVHTQPTDEAGTEVGRVLHVATGIHTTDQYERLTDPEWSSMLQADAPARPEWLPAAFVP